MPTALSANAAGMFISVDRCEIGLAPGVTAITEIKEQLGFDIIPLVTVADIYAYLKKQPEYREYLPAMEQYMAQYCVFQLSIVNCQLLRSVHDHLRHRPGLRHRR
ncbi:MAG: hypothetical protein FWE80_09250, partial [Oscillospiraceae bacterium]|nr:hypothetical protein [Oscillospiraceae bacterium]